jgi:hypothetical protein
MIVKSTTHVGAIVGGKQSPRDGRICDHVTGVLAMCGNSFLFLIPITDSQPCLDFRRAYINNLILGGISEEDLVVLPYFLLASAHFSEHEVEAYSPEILASQRGLKHNSDTF